MGTVGLCLCISGLSDFCGGTWISARPASRARSSIATGGIGCTGTIDVTGPGAVCGRPRLLAVAWVSAPCDPTTVETAPCQDEAAFGEARAAESSLTMVLSPVSEGCSKVLDPFCRDKATSCCPTAESRRDREREEGSSVPVGSATAVSCIFWGESVSVLGRGDALRSSRGKVSTSVRAAAVTGYGAGVASSCGVLGKPFRAAPSTKVNSCKDMTRSLTLVAPPCTVATAKGSIEASSPSSICRLASARPDWFRCFSDTAFSARFGCHGADFTGWTGTSATCGTARPGSLESALGTSCVAAPCISENAAAISGSSAAERVLSVGESSFEAVLFPAIACRSGPEQHSLPSRSIGADTPLPICVIISAKSGRSARMRCAEPWAGSPLVRAAVSPSEGRGSDLELLMGNGARDIRFSEISVSDQIARMSLPLLYHRQVIVKKITSIGANQCRNPLPLSCIRLSCQRMHRARKRRPCAQQPNSSRPVFLPKC